MAAEVVSPPRIVSGSRHRGTKTGLYLLLPAAAMLSVFFLIPVFLMLQTSFEKGTQTYAGIFSSPLYGQVLWNTAKTALLTMLISLLLSYPYAYVLNRVGPKLHMLMLAVVLLPFWTSLLVRSFAWVGLLQDAGMVNALLQGLGLTHAPIEFIRTPAGVLIGMVHVMLPYMVLPLMTTMSQIDPALLRAAQSFGAGPWQRFVRIFLPLSLPGIVSGSILVFVLSLGFYITPSLLGGTSDVMIGETIVQQVTRFGPVTASALGLILLAGTLITLALLLAVRSVGRPRESGNQ
jgi:ABC-type spermidine/putrescine transport system permease subunit I